ncbi:hypothetical protein FAIPA1_190027 [Frankia sp. AiPs1]
MLAVDHGPLPLREVTGSFFRVLWIDSSTVNVT